MCRPVQARGQRENSLLWGTGVWWSKAVLPLPRCVTLGKLRLLSEPQFAPAENGINNSPRLTVLV